MANLPPSGTLAKYNRGGPIGILPGQSMFATDSTRNGMFDGRSSFVRMLNIIFARNSIAIDRTLQVETLNAETPIDQYLIWRQAKGAKYIEPIPPIDEWSYIDRNDTKQSIQVFTAQERDRLLIDPSFAADIEAGKMPRVLINGIGNGDAPQWSVYEVYFVAPNTPAFKLSKSYDFHVTSFHDRDLLPRMSSPIALGQRVLVDGNTSTSGFWTVWQYVGIGNTDADAAGFKLVRYQTYQTSDFWSYVDWYANGYSTAEPPVVRYATPKARDIAENPKPTTTFVRVDDDGTGVWVWTSYIDGAWVVVARQNGTISFSSQFYDNPSRPVIGFDPISNSVLSQIPSRDGSWEFKVLFNLLQDSALLENLEINELFFSMLHFIHTQQDQVAWAFKTSFLSVGGYNELLTQTPVQPIDNTANLLTYIDEVKPYRVKTREFTQIVTPNLDNAVVSATDFDFPPYYDTTTGKYRTLSLDSPSDLDIIQNQQPWSSWYSAYLKPEFRPDNYLAGIWNGVRHFNIRMDFDRVDHMPIITSQKFVFNSAKSNPFDLYVDLYSSIDLRQTIVEVFINETRLRDADFSVSSNYISLYVTPINDDIINVVVRQALSINMAADRIQRFYDPTNSQAAEKNLRTLMGLNFKGNVFDGGILSNNTQLDYNITGATTGATTDETINPKTKYFGLADPAMEENRPEELVVTGSGESLHIIITQANTTTMVATSRPTSDLFAPAEVGDFDARPLEEISYDHGITYDSEMVTSKSINGTSSSISETYAGQQFNPYNGQYRNVYVEREDSFETTDYSNVGGILAVSLTDTSNSIVITPSVSGTMAFSIPVTEQIINANNVVETITKPGVVWINNERIEFFQYNVSNTTVTLSEIRRSTKNTRFGFEQRSLVQYTADGTNTTFFMSNATAAEVMVTVNEVLRRPNNTVIEVDGYTGYNINVPKNIGLDFDYTVVSVSNGINIIFNKAPRADTVVYLTKTSSFDHPIGSSVYSSRNK